MKTDTAWNEVVDQAEKDFYTLGISYPECNKSYPSSDNADAYQIAFWALYWNGKKPVGLHKSRGYKWTAYIPGAGNLTVMVENWKDHRNGIKVISA